MRAWGFSRACVSCVFWTADRAVTSSTENQPWPQGNTEGYAPHPRMRSVTAGSRRCPRSRWLYRNHPLSSEKAMAPHSSTLAWKIPWTEGPGRLQSMGSHRVGYDWSDLAAAAAALIPLAPAPHPVSPRASSHPARFLTVSRRDHRKSWT